MMIGNARAERSCWCVRNDHGMLAVVCVFSPYCVRWPETYPLVPVVAGRRTVRTVVDLNRRRCVMRAARHNSRQLFPAWICIFAALCLYAPLAVAAWPASASCCDGNRCAVPTHTHGNAKSETGRAMQCKHGAASMANCSMACCQQQEGTPIAPVTFVMPPPVALSAPVADASRVCILEPNEFSRSAEPLSPPPRTSLFSL